MLEFEMIGATKDEQAVNAALSKYMRRAPIRRLTKQVLRAQGALRRLIGDTAWRAYLRLEALVGEREMRVLDGAIRIALRQGREATRRRRRG